MSLPSNKLSNALALVLFSTSASLCQAASINSNGVGQVLLYPYYTVNGGNQTLISVVNTTDRVKAVNVRFQEGRNSKTVMNFSLYLSAFDTWTGAVFALDNSGAANLITLDSSCTVPILANEPSSLSLAGSNLRYIPFKNFAYNGNRRDFPTTASDAAQLGSLERTREGHLSMIEMGVLSSGDAAAQLADEATLSTAGVPSNCQKIENAWSAGVWTNNRTEGVSAPSGGLFGSAEVIDVANGTNLSYNATAIEGFYTSTSAPGALHFSPIEESPNLLSAASLSTTTAQIEVDNPLSDERVAVTEFFSLNESTPDAISLLFMRSTLMNEFNTETSLDAASEWVVTFPTKRFYVDTDSDGSVKAPFTEAFRDDGAACEKLGLVGHSRNGGEFTRPTRQDFVGVPPPPNELQLCNSVNVLVWNRDLNDPRSILNSATSIRLNANFDGSNESNKITNGWARLNFDNPLVEGAQNSILVQSSGIRYQGLPALGFWAANYVNSASQPGLLANFSATHPHRSARAKR